MTSWVFTLWNVGRGRERARGNKREKESEGRDAWCWESIAVVVCQTYAILISHSIIKSLSSWISLSKWYQYRRASSSVEELCCHADMMVIRGEIQRGKLVIVVRLAARKSLIHRLRANLENNTMYSLITIILASVAHWQSLWYRGAILAWPAGAVVLRKALRTRRS